MNHMRLIRQAWDITWHYRVLWLFGVLLALGGEAGGGGNGLRYVTDGRGTPLAPSLQPLPHVAPEALIAVVGICCCLFLFLGLLLLILRYVARASLYRMADQIAAGTAAPDWRTGFRLGWGPRTFRLFLLDLVVGIPFVSVALLLLALGASPLLLLAVRGEITNVLAVLLTVGCEFLVIGFLILAGAALSVLLQYWSREVVLADRSIGTALASGWKLARSRLKDTAVMGLLMLAIGLGFSIVLIPVVVVVLLVAVGVGGGLGYAVHAATHSIFWATAAGLPPGLLILLVPLIFIQGIYLAFNSTAWTLAYRGITQVPGPSLDSAADL